MSMDARDLQELKAPSPIVVTELGMSMDAREEHSLKAAFPIVVTELGMSMDAREVQFSYLLLVDYQYYTL